MKRLFVLSGICFLCLTACSNPQAMLKDSVETASGAFTEAKNRVNTVVQPIVETAKDIQKRAQTVKEGMDDIATGKAKIQEGLSR